MACLVDLTSSDIESENLDSDGEHLSLQERIAKRQRNEDWKSPTAKSTLVAENPSPNKKTCSSISDSEKDFIKKMDSDDDLELPSLADILGIKKNYKCISDESELSKPKNKPYEASSNTVDDVVILESELICTHELTSGSKTSKITQKTKQVDQSEKEMAKLEKMRLKEEKKREKDLAKALKASEKEILKSKKPEECLKGMKVILDHNLVFVNGSEDILCALDEAELRHAIEDNPVAQSILWCKTVFDVTVEDSQVVKEEREELENTLVLLINEENFVKMVYASVQQSKDTSGDNQSLLDYIMNIKNMFPQSDITCTVVGLDKYLRLLKENSPKCPESKKLFKTVSRTAIDEALLEVQLQAVIHFNFLNSMRELADLLVRFSKAIAEAPRRREKQQQKSEAFSWYADADSNCPVKLGKDGHTKLWQQQIQQFNNVGPEIAEALASKYPSPQMLLQAYNNCSSQKEAETLLQDIVVRRNYGPLGTQRRIGPELSFKIFLFFNSTNGSQSLQR